MSVDDVERELVEHWMRFHRRVFGASPRTCEHCGKLYARGRREAITQYARRRFCGRSCAMTVTNNSEALNARYRGYAESIIADVELLLESGESKERIAQRLGYAQRAYLRDRLHKWGRHDLAQRMFVRAS